MFSLKIIRFAAFILPFPMIKPVIKILTCKIRFMWLSNTRKTQLSFLFIHRQNHLCSQYMILFFRNPESKPLQNPGNQLLKPLQMLVKTVPFLPTVKKKQKGIVRFGVSKSFVS